MRKGNEHTEVIPAQAGALGRFPILSISRAMLERCVLVPNMIEEMDLVFPRKQSYAHTMYGRIAPALHSTVS